MKYFFLTNASFFFFRHHIKLEDFNVKIRYGCRTRHTLTFVTSSGHEYYRVYIRVHVTLLGTTSTNSNISKKKVTKGSKEIKELNQSPKLRETIRAKKNGDRNSRLRRLKP